MASRSKCIGGVLNDLMADSRGGVYFSATRATGSGVFYADPKGAMTQYGTDVPLANGIILSPDEKTLYFTNGAVVFAFDVKPDGSLTKQREFGKLRGGECGTSATEDWLRCCSRSFTLVAWRNLRKMVFPSRCILWFGT